MGVLLARARARRLEMAGLVAFRHGVEVVDGAGLVALGEWVSQEEVVEVCLQVVMPLAVGTEEEAAEGL